MDAEPQNISLPFHTAESARTLIDRLCAVYADAYGIESTGKKIEAFRERATKGMNREGFQLVTAHAGNELVGFAFGYALSAGDIYWWKGLRPEPAADFTVETGTRTFVLAEIEICRSWQAIGIGKRIHDKLLSGRNEERTTLAANPAASETHAVYQGWGWKKAGQVAGAFGDYFDAYDLFVFQLSNEFPR